MMEREKIMEYVERKRVEHAHCLAKPEKYRKTGELESIELTLLVLECLAMECGLIKTGTI